MRIAGQTAVTRKFQALYQGYHRVPTVDTLFKLSLKRPIVNFLALSNVLISHSQVVIAVVCPSSQVFPKDLDDTENPWQATCTWRRLRAPTSAIQRHPEGIEIDRRGAFDQS
jgi:hypothetical protein